jgi:phenylalanyl-tRNA synthetase beta chain
MIISYSWLNEMVDVPVSPDELAEVLTFLGLEVEEVHRYVPSLDKVVIGEVVECHPVQGSDHLSFTQVYVGSDTLPIVCGAPNVRQDQIVVVMLPDAVTADGKRIKKAKLRGIESHGMIASELELGLSHEHLGIIEGDPNWRIGANAGDYINLGDTTYDVEITPNRPDYLAHAGVARDLAAKFKIPWHKPEHRLIEIEEPTASQVRVEIITPEACPRYAARVMRGVKIGPTPYATRLRLTRCGVRPISNIVDVTNYVMLELGHPLHAFDQRFIAGNLIRVRYANPQEKFETLDGKAHELGSRDLLIADAEKGIALAGVMGGLNSEIRDDTQNVIIECAYFDPIHIRRTAKAHELGTESSRRFERGTDPNHVDHVIDSTAAMMQQLAGGEVLKDRVDEYPRKIASKTISFRPSRAAHVIGLEVPATEIEDIFARLGCGVDCKSAPWKVTAPTYRPDLEREIDLVEEAIRVHGYDQIPIAPSSKVPLAGNLNAMHQFRTKVVDAMVSLGFQETMSLSMYTPDDRRDPPDMPKGVELTNPVTDDMQVMQGSLLPQLVRSVASNWQRGDRNLRLFEVARAFQRGRSDDPQTWERQMLAAVMTGNAYPQSWAHPSKSFDFYDLKGMIDVFCAKILLDKDEIFCYDIESRELLTGGLRVDGQVCGQWGIWSAEVMAKRDIDAPVGWFELDLGLLFQRQRPGVKYEPLPRFPVSWRDLAIVVSESVAAEELLKVIRAAAGECLVRAEPFDIFRNPEKLGPEKKSLAIRLDFSHPQRSLEADEVDEWMHNIVNRLQTDCGAVLR